MSRLPLSRMGAFRSGVVVLLAGIAVAAGAVPAGAAPGHLVDPNGPLWSWGNSRGLPVPVPVKLPAGTTATQIATGGPSLVLTSAGHLLAWGNNDFGQLGDGTHTSSDVPVPVKLPAGTTVTAIAVGGVYSLALTSTGKVLAWGDNSEGELGDGTHTSSDVPVPVSLPTGTRVTAIAAAAAGLALTSTGKVLAWGDNRTGGLGDGSTISSDVPVPVHLPAGTTVTAIFAGFLRGLAVTSSGQLLTWGSSIDGSPNNTVPVPVHLPAGTTVTAVVTTETYTLVLTSTGRLLAWGSGVGGSTGRIPVLLKVPAGTTITAIADGSSSESRCPMALTGAGQVVAWGSDCFDLGSEDGFTSDHPVRIDFPTGTIVSAFACGNGGCLSILRVVGTTTSLAAAPASQRRGEPVSLTARVHCPGEAAAGSVTFRAEQSDLGAATVHNGEAKLTVHTITLGRHHITAEYHGDTPCAASVSKPVAVTITAVSPATPSTTFVPGPGLTGDIRSSGPTLAPILVALALVVLVFAGGLTGRRLRHAGSPRHRD